MIAPYYQKNNITIYHGDCASIVPQLEPVYALVTDPPYGIGESSKKAKRRGSKKVPPTDFGEFDWDQETPSKALFDMLRERSQYQVIFGGNYFELPPTNCFLVWDKDNGTTDFADAELAWTNLKKAVRLIKYKWQGYCQGDMSNKELRLHPTQKPVAVMQWCLEQLPAKSGGVILDPFCGSGSTLLAARRLGLPAIGIDQDERYCAIAKRTLEGELARFKKEEGAAIAKRAGQMSLFLDEH